MIEFPGEINGSGDNAILLIGKAPGSITIQANPDNHVLKVTDYGSAETELVNTKEPYDGVINIPLNPVVLEIESQGDWEILVREK